MAVFWLLAITLSIICYSNKVSLMQSYSFLTNQPSALQCQKAFLKQTKSLGGNHASSFWESAISSAPLMVVKVVQPKL